MKISIAYLAEQKRMHEDPGYGVSSNAYAPLVLKFGLISIPTGEALKRLSDGRNAHLIQKPAAWWLPRLCERLEIAHLQRTEDGVYLLVEPRPDF